MNKLLYSTAQPYTHTHRTKIRKEERTEFGFRSSYGDERRMALVSSGRAD